MSHLSYQDLTSIESIFQAWNEFKKGKGKKKDVQKFEMHIEDNLFKLYWELKNKTYQHQQYTSFYVHDPKQRHIHKPTVTDRVVHHMLYKYLYKLYDPAFIYDSYSCRIDKGTHKGVQRLEKFTRTVSKNYRKPCWTLKCDIKKFFASVDHEILQSLLSRKIKDFDVLRLLLQVTDSFHSEYAKDKGIPLGNLTSQIFANIYLNELDQFVKHKLKVKYYLRYADDFLILGEDKRQLIQDINILGSFLRENLNLELHPKKIILRKLEWGIDFLGYTVLPHYRLARTKTKRRIFKQLRVKVNSETFGQSFQSYLGYLKHANSYKVQQELKQMVFLLTSRV